MYRIKYGIFIILASCSHSRANIPQVYTVDDVILNNKAYLEKPVVVSGYLRFGDDSRNLWSTKQSYVKVTKSDIDPEDAAWNRCITLYDVGSFREDLIKYNNHYVIISGVVRRIIQQEGEITTSACNELGISVRSVKLQ